MSPNFEIAVDWPCFLSRHDLTWDHPPTAWHEGAFLGNGLLGAVIYFEGNAALRWDISRSDVTEYTVMKRHHREPSGHLLLRPAGAVRESSMHLDLWNAEARGKIVTDAGEVRWRSFVHSDRMLLVIETEATGDEAGLTWEWVEDSVSWEKIFPGKEPLPGPAPVSRREQRPSGGVWSRPFREGGEQAVAWREIRAEARKRVLLLSAACSRPEAIAHQEACDTLDRAECEGLPQLESSHRAWWHRYYEQSFLTVPDARLESFYWIQIYKLGAATRGDRAPIDVLGPWWMKQAWPAIWWNLNIQLSYSPVYAANRLELGESLCRLLDRGLPNMIENVPEKYRADSAALPRTTGFDCSGRWAGGVPDSGAEICNLPYACHNYWLQWRYSMDEGVLRRLFLILRRAIAFYLHLLTPDAQGRLHLPVAISPEYRPPAPDTNIDLALLRWGCMALLEACHRLNIDDPLIPRWKYVLEHLADYPVDDSGLMIGAGVPLAVSHRHHSHLFIIYPLHLMNPEDPAERALIEKSFQHWIGLKGGHAGYSYAIAAAFCALLGRGNDALRYLEEFLDRYPTANTMYLEAAPASSGLEDGALIETPLAAANSIQEMLLQSWGGVLRVFPAVPDHWRNLAFANLRGEGAFLVSAARVEGSTQFIRIESLAGEPCRLKCDMKAFRLFASSPDISVLRRPDGTLEIGLRKGETAILIAEGAEAARCAPVPLEPGRLNYYGSRKARPIRARWDGAFHLLASEAELSGPFLRYEKGGVRNHLTHWRATEDCAAWNICVETPGEYAVMAAYRLPAIGATCDIVISASGATLVARVEEHQGTVWEPYRQCELGKLRFDAAGRHRLSVQVRSPAHDNRFCLFKVTLVPQRPS